MSMEWMDGCEGESNARWQRGGVKVSSNVAMSAQHHNHDGQARIKKSCRMYTVSREGMGNKSGFMGETNKQTALQREEPCRKKAQAQQRKSVTPKRKEVRSLGKNKDD